jgi:YVTN family beta-propeller protein
LVVIMTEIGRKLLLSSSLLALLVVPAASAQTGDLDPPLRLEVDSYFVGLTETSTFTIFGPPGAQYKLESSNVPTELATSWGTQFLSNNDLEEEAGGFLSELGEATVVVTHPAGRLDGTLKYYQARGKLGQGRGLSNSIGIRFSTIPEGRRKPEAIVATADGTRAYVAHAVEGTISVIDTATDSVVLDMPVTQVPPVATSQSLELAIDPEGRHLFLVNPLLPNIAVIDIASNSISGQIPVPTSSRAIAFSYTGANRLMMVTNEGARSLLRFRERPLGKFKQLQPTPLEGDGAGPLAVLPDRTILIGNRSSLDLELISTTSPIPTLERIHLGSAPYKILVSGTRAFVTTFTSTDPIDDGNNEVLEVDLTTRQVVGAHLLNHGTDYFDALLSDDHLFVVGAGSGSIVVADPVSLAMLDVVELAPGEPAAVPTRVALVPDPVTGDPDRLYVANFFRETVRPIDLAAGAPFPLQPEIVLGHSGAPRVPGVDLSDVETGEWFFNSVEFFNGTSASPNPTTCATCHPRGFSDNIIHGRIQAQEMFDIGATEPFRFDGSTDTIEVFTVQAFNKHGLSGGELELDAREKTILFQEIGIPLPLSPFLEPDGSLSPQAEAGKIIFEGVAGCAGCHTPPLFIPELPEDRTIEEGVGTGQVPANVPSLRGKWATAPHLHDGSAPTLMDVLLLNVNDEHGTTSTLTQQELDDLVAYLLSL